MKKNKIDKRKKSNKIFNHVAKRVHKLSKKQGLGFTWQQSQKFTSANVFQKFKGQAVSKIKVTEIDKVTNSVLEAQKLPFQAIPLPKGKAIRPKEICDDVDKIPDVFLEPINWWALPDAIARFPDMVNIEVEFEGIISTGITKKVNLPSMLPIREYFRNSRVSSEVTIIFKKLVRPDRTDDGQPCSYYILATIEGSSFDIETMGQEKKGFVSLKNLTQEERDKIAKQEAEFRAESKAKAKTKKSVKETPRPKQVEAKPSQEPTKKISTARIKEFNRATENLERQFDKKIITRKEFQERLKKLNDSLENGGEV